MEERDGSRKNSAKVAKITKKAGRHKNFQMVKKKKGGENLYSWRKTEQGTKSPKPFVDIYRGNQGKLKEGKRSRMSNASKRKKKSSPHLPVTLYEKKK